jgi:hypothetical protein
VHVEDHERGEPVSVRLFVDGRERAIPPLRLPLGEVLSLRT